MLGLSERLSLAVAIGRVYRLRALSSEVMKRMIHKQGKILTEW